MFAGELKEEPLKKKNLCQRKYSKGQLSNRKMRKVRVEAKEKRIERKKI